MPRVRWVASLLLVLLPALTRRLPAGVVYWSENTGNEIRRANTDGTQQQFVATALDARGVGVQDNNLYWFDLEAHPGENSTFDLRRSNLDGTNAQSLISSPATSDSLQSNSIAFDNAGHIYWAGNGIYRANLDGTGIQTLSNAANVGGVAVDAQLGKMFWTLQFGQSIWEANLDGSSPQLLISALEEPTGITLDPAKNLLYWADWLGTIHRANLDGTNQTVLFASGAGSYGLALDAPNNELYWVTGLDGTVRRASTTGAGQETLASNLSFPIGIALDLNAAVLVPSPKAVWIGLTGVLFATLWMRGTWKASLLKLS